MQKLIKLFKTFGLYWQYSLDTILTHIFVIAFLQAGFTTTAAILMSLDSIFKITFSVMTARITLRIPREIRGKISASLKLFLVLIWFIAISFLLRKRFSLFTFIPYILFKLILIFDSFLSSEFIFALRKYFSIDLTQSTAAQNILIRASTSIAPAAALLILSMPQLKMYAAILMLILISFSVYSLKNIFFSAPVTSTTSNIRIKNLPFIKLMANPYMRWSIAYQFLANLAFAGVSFILLNNLSLHSNVFLNEITILYFSFFLVQILVLIYGENIIPLNHTSHIAFIMGITGFFIILASVSHYSIFRLTCCSIIGLLYSYTLSSVQKIVATKTRGLGYLEYIGWAQMIGRSTSFAVTLLLGFAVHIKITTSSLLMLCGILGIISALILIKIK